MFNFVAHENVDHSVQTISERSSRVLWTKAIGAIDVFGEMGDVHLGFGDF